MRSTLMPASRAAPALPPTAWISWPIEVRSTSTHRTPSTSTMMTMLLGMPNSQRPSESCRKASGTPATIGTPAE